MRIALAVLVAHGLMGCAGAPGNLPDPTTRNEQFQVVRFHVKTGQESEFERFFSESLLPATERLAESSEALRRELDAFTLLRPLNSPGDGPSTYYLLYRIQAGGGQAQGEVMRDIVRQGFPGPDGERRVQRWMNSLDLESLVPVGQRFESVVFDSGSGS